MNSATLNPRRWRSRTVGSESERGDYISAIAGLAGLLLFSLDTIAPHWVTMAQMQNDTTHNSNTRDTREVGGVESLIAGYVGNPIYYRSNINVVRPDGTDLKLKGLGWDGDALHFPIDGGVRYVRWNDRFGFMVDFLHNKAIARLGKSSHGRKLKYPVIEEVSASGTFKGKPVPSRIKLTKSVFHRAGPRPEGKEGPCLSDCAELV